MRTVFIFHGTGGYPDENWFPWMRQGVEKSGYIGIVPHFPTPEGQSLQAWLEVLKPYRNHIGSETVLIGHSLGGLFLLRLLEQLEVRVKAAFFIAAPVGVDPIKNFKADEAFAGGFSFDWEVIRKKAEYFSVFHSDTDPYVSLENGERLAQELGTSLTFVPNAGHFNVAAGYIEFPQLWEQVQALL